VYNYKMISWISYLKNALARQRLDDPIAQKKEKTSMKVRLKNLWPSISRHRRKGIVGALLLIFTSLLGFPLPLIFRYLIDNVILAKELRLLAGVVIILVGVKLLSLVFGALQQFYFVRFEQEIILDIQHKLLDTTLRLPKSFFDQKETGYLMSRLLGDVNGLRFFFSSTLVHVFTSILRLIGGIVLLFYLKWQLALMVLIALPVLIFLVRYFAHKTRILSHHRMEQSANVSRSLQETLSSTTLIKSFSTEERTVNKVTDELRSAMNLGIEQSTMSSAAGLTIGVVPEIARVLVLIVGAYWVIMGDWTLGSLLAFRSYVGFVYGPAQFLATTNLSFQNALAALERVSALFDIVPEENLGKGKKVKKLKGKIEFNGVSFSYNDQDMVLEDVNLKVNPGEKIAIVGPSGIGKTTLLSLILCFYRPSQGEIRFDGIPVSEYDLGSLRKRMGYVSQDPELLSGTIMENLVYGSPDADKDEVIKIARVAGIHDFIMSLEKGYESRVGERGVNLSVGQKQRLAIGRALIKDPDILILDEPASALDSVTENLIFSELPKLIKNKTQFVVAHRKSTIKNARRILLLNDKKLMAMGSHEELMETSELYRSMIEGQKIG